VQKPKIRFDSKKFFELSNFVLTNLPTSSFEIWGLVMDMKLGRTRRCEGVTVGGIHFPLTPKYTHKSNHPHEQIPLHPHPLIQPHPNSSPENFKIRNKSLSSTCMVLTGPKVNHIQSIQPSFIWSVSIGYYNYWRFNPCWNSCMYDLCWI